jgi:two-component system, NarL family, response regulator NreC
MPITILLVDDHVILRQGLRLLLSQQPDFYIIGEAGTGVEALQMVEKMRPDVVVMDIDMPGLNGLETTRQIASLPKKSRVVILSMYDNETSIQQALTCGAMGYVVKGEQVHELVEAIRTVINGDVYLSPAITERDIDTIIQRSFQFESPLELVDTLTRRERLVIALAAQGYTSQMIADQLGLSARTVEDHRSHAMRKLKLNNQTELVRYAIKHGLIQKD